MLEIPDSNSQLQKDLIFGDTFMKKMKGNKRPTGNNANQLITINLNSHFNLNFQIKSRNGILNFLNDEKEMKFIIV